MAFEGWKIDGVHSGIHFAVRHLLVSKVRGRFTRWSGSFTVEDGDLARASVEATVDAASIETGVADRDAHLRSPDFLDVARFPELSFASRSIETLDADRLRVVGDLTLHGVTREVALDVEVGGTTKDPGGDDRIGLTAKTSISRKAFGLTWNQLLETGGAVVGDRIDIDIEVEAVKQVAAKAA